MITKDLQIDVENERVTPDLWSTRSGVVSLYDMLRLYAEFFFEGFKEINETEVKWRSHGIVPIPQAVAAMLINFELECATHGLISTAQKSERIRNKCHTQQVVFNEIAADLKDLRERFEDELKSHVFLHLSSQEAELYEKPAAGDWHTVIMRFPRTRHDIEESSKCFALGRYAASLFHVLLVAEFGIIQVANFFNAAGNRPGWGDLERIERIHNKKWGDKTPLEQQNSEFLKNLLPLAFAIKDSWRHKISHADNKLDWIDTDFSPEVAKEIISATRGFMRTIARDLPK